MFTPAGDGRCYRACFNYLMAHQGHFLVHGILTNPSGRRITHAWVEYFQFGGLVVFDLVAGERFTQEYYYSAYKAENIHRYSQLEAQINAEESGLYGPWDITSLRSLAAQAVPHAAASPKSIIWIREMFEKYRKGRRLKK